MFISPSTVLSDNKCKKLSKMQVLLYTVLFTSLTITLAIPPQRFQSPQRFTTLARQQSPPPAIPPAPYNPSGWQPQGERFVLPSRQTAPAGPSPSYGPPRDVYGPPTTTEVITTTDIDFTEEPEAESFKLRPLQSQAQTTAQNVERGQYYLLLSDGRLQKVQYVTSADLQRMAYSAKLRYEDVEPISGPIFTAANNQPFIPTFQKK